MFTHGITGTNCEEISHSTYKHTQNVVVVKHIVKKWSQMSFAALLKGVIIMCRPKRFPSDLIL